MNKKKTKIVNLFQVCLPSLIVWPGKVTLHICYTREEALGFIEDYPLRYFVPYMFIEEKEVIMREE